MKTSILTIIISFFSFATIFVQALPTPQLLGGGGTGDLVDGVVSTAGGIAGGVVGGVGKKY